MTQASNLGKGGSNFNASGQLSLTTGVTGTLPAANGGTGTTTFPSPGTSGNVLTSNGTVWTSAAAAAFDAGTRMLFAQTSAPTGWTKDTTNYNNYALRVVTGAASTGGSVAFTTAFASQTPTITTSGLSAGATTLTTAQIPSHTHSSRVKPDGPFGENFAAPSFTNGSTAYSTGSEGGGGSHTHAISGSATSSAINLAVQYLDVITATKN